MCNHQLQQGKNDSKRRHVAFESSISEGEKNMNHWIGLQAKENHLKNNFQWSKIWVPLNFALNQYITSRFTHGWSMIFSKGRLSSKFLSGPTVLVQR